MPRARPVVTLPVRLGPSSREHLVIVGTEHGASFELTLFIRQLCVFSPPGHFKPDSPRVPASGLEVKFCGCLGIFEG